MNNDQIDFHAKVIWDYMIVGLTPVKSDAVFCLCSHDTRVAVRAAELMRQGYRNYLIISGGLGKLTKDIFTKSEAEVFMDIAVKEGVNPEKIIIESKSTNTGENVRFTYQLLKEMNLQITSFVLVQKPYMERRTYATFKQQWPDTTTAITVTSPQLNFEEYASDGIPKNEVINVMVGDLQRIREYPKLGYQIQQDLPKSVWESFEKLVAAGFDEHLMTS